jgi:hypothetical protein
MLTWNKLRTELEGVRENIMPLRVVLAVLWTIMILVLCWTPQALLPVSEEQDSLVQQFHLDKFVHAGTFTVFCVLWLRTRIARRSWYVSVLLAGTALAALTELVQNLPLINREGELGDFIADFAGLLLGFPLFRLIEQQLRSNSINK